MNDAQAEHEEVVLNTKRLELRPSRPEFIDDVWEAVAASLPELGPWMHWAIDCSRDSTLDYLHHCADEWSSGHDRNFTLFANGSACGSCALIRVDAIQMNAEIGYWMRSDLCGNNLMTEAAYEVVSFGFGQEGLHRIELHAGVENLASIRVAEKLGFQKEGIHRHGGRGTKGFYDSYSFGLLSSDVRPRLT